MGVYTMQALHSRCSSSRHRLWPLALIKLHYCMVQHEQEDMNDVATLYAEVVILAIDVSRYNASKVTAILILVAPVHDIYHALCVGIALVAHMRWAVVPLPVSQGAQQRFLSISSNIQHICILCILHKAVSIAYRQSASR
eukprot:14419-Heterococcus_DN1.PRE.2